MVLTGTVSQGGCRITIISTATASKSPLNLVVVNFHMPGNWRNSGMIIKTLY